MRAGKIVKSVSAVLCMVLLICLLGCESEKEQVHKKTKKKIRKEKEMIWQDDPIAERDDFVSSQLSYRNLDYYEEQIKAFEQKGIEKGKILFYGSSTFTRWTAAWSNPSLESILTSSSGERVCINHGFGGATLHEMCYYYERAVKAWSPRVLVTTVSFNGSEFYNNTQIMQYFQWLCSKTRADFPGIKIYVLNCKPNAQNNSASYIERLKEMNALLDAYAKVHNDVTVIDLAHERMFYLDDESAQNGSYTDTNRAIFADDKKHMNAEGYKKFAEIFKQYLKDDLG